MNYSIRTKSLLFVEGKDDKFFFYQFLKHLKIVSWFIPNFANKSEEKYEKKEDTTVEIELLSFDGNPQKNIVDLLENTKIRAGFNNVKKIGIIMDAELEKNKLGKKTMLERIESSMKEAGLKKDNLSVDIFIVTDSSKKEGMLEDLLYSVLPESNQTCIEAYFKCVGIPEKDYSKKKIQTCLAGIKKEYVSSLGFVSEKNYCPWNFDDPIFNDLKSFLQNLRIPK